MVRLGALGARIRLWESMDEAHWGEQMALRKPALVILQFGTNESEDGWFNTDVYEKSVRLVLSKVKSAAPGASILMTAPLDRAKKGDDGRLHTKKVILRLIASQRKVGTKPRSPERRSPERRSPERRSPEAPLSFLSA